MSVRFILGRAGTGKTRYCFEQIRALHEQAPLGPPIFWLLPRQATFQAERELTMRLNGFSRIHVVSFEELGGQILASCGDVGIPQITPLGRRLIIGHLLRTLEPSLRFYQSCARRAGLAAQMDNTFSELERAGAQGESFIEAASHLDAADPLRDKLHDITLLLNSYRAYVGQDRLDPQRRLEKVMHNIASCGLLKNAYVFVDDFYDLSGFELKMLTAVATICRRTQIALLVDLDSEVVADPNRLPDDLSLFHRTERTYRALHWALTEQEIEIEAPVFLRESCRYEAPALAELEHNLFRATGDGSVTSSPAIELIDAPHARIEVDAVARRIRDAVGSGVRLREIAVLVRGIGDYQGLIDASFAEHELAYFVDRRRTAAHHPLLQFVRSALLIALHGWPHDAVMSLLKSGLTGISQSQCDELENYVLLHRIRGKMWQSPQPWLFRRKLTRGRSAEELANPAALDQIDVIRRQISETFRPFISAVAQPQRTVAQIIAQLISLLEDFSVRSTLAQWMRDAQFAGDLQQYGEHEQVWAELIDLLEQLCALLGKEQITLSDFLDAFDAGLESFDLALAPPSVDSILVGQIDRTRTPIVKMVFVLGLNEGQFPRVQREDCVLSDSDRRALVQQKITLGSQTDRKLLDERLLAYIAFTQASQKLVLTRPLAGGKGHAANPSAFWNELIRLYPQITVEHESHESLADPGAVGTPRQLITSLMNWTKHADGSGLAQDVWPALYQWLANYSVEDDSIGAMRRRAWKALSYANNAALDAATARRLFPSPLEASVAQLETFATCPFQHFVRYGLGIDRRESTDVTKLDLHNVYHRILEDLIGDIIKQRTDWCEIDPAVLAKAIQHHAARIGKQLRGELMLSSARNRYLLERVERTLAQAIESQRESHRRGCYRPIFAGLSFGVDDKLPAHSIATEAGNTVQLRGKIDRVDLHENGTSFTVSDYKLTGRPLALDRVFYGITLQLLTYLLVLQQSGELLVGKKLTPAAAFYLQLLQSHQTIEHPDLALAPDHPDFHLQIRPRGILESSTIPSLDVQLTEGQSSVVQVRINKDGKLGYRNNSDAAGQHEFAALLQWVDRKLAELADCVIGGDIGIAPYWINRATPCPNCSYRSICRFEPGVNKYNFLAGMKREDVLNVVSGHAERGDADEE